MIPRVLSFDLDDTLWPVAPAHRRGGKGLIGLAARALSARGADHSVESMRALRARVAERHPERIHDLTFLRKTALAEQFAAAGHDASLAGPAFEVFYTARNRVQFYPDVRPALAQLRRRYPLYALSNGNADLALCGIADLFSGHLTARAAGVAKPDPRIFAKLAAQAGVAPAEVLHVGDDPLLDVDGARRAGMQAAWLNRDGRSWPAHLGAPALTITSLAELS